MSILQILLIKSQSPVTTLSEALLKEKREKAGVGEDGKEVRKRRKHKMELEKGELGSEPSNTHLNAKNWIKYIIQPFFL